MQRLRRRTFLTCSVAALAEAASSPLAWAVPTPYSWEATPPNTSAEAFVKWMVANRGEDAHFLLQRFSRYQTLVANRDVLDDRNKRAFLMTPREEFTLKRNQARAYEHAFLDIGFGVTISGPHVVCRMTSTLDVKFGEKVLEIGTGSGYQSAYLANLTDKVWTIEIIKPLAERTRGVYDALIARGYTEYKAITSRQCRRLLRLAGGGAVRQDHRHLRHRPRSAAAAAAAESGRDHGDPGRPARRPAAAQDHQGAGGGRHHKGRPVGHLRR